MDMGSSTSMGGMNMGHNHSHDDMSHGMDDKYHSSVVRLPDGGYTYTHGAFLGHIVPGTFFILWGSWWAVSTFVHFLRSRAARKPFRSRPWYFVPAGPAWLREAPIEPALMVVLPLFGILGELWLGHESWRSLYAEDGKFLTDNINDWQHSLMYSCFITSGAVDLVGHYLELPPAMEQAFLGLAFLGEALLLVFHLKGPTIEILLHLILVLQVGATVLAVLGETLAPSSLVAACMRPYFTIVQGVWWIQTAAAMYTSNPAYDPDYMGGSMMVPALFVLWLLVVAAGMLVCLVAMRALGSKLAGQPIPWDLAAAGGSTANGRLEEGDGPELEMSSLMQHKHLGLSHDA